MDFTYLEDFAAGDEALVVEVLTIFRDQAEEWAAGLAGGAPGDALHALKGSARGIGAVELGDLCESAEQDGSVARVQASLAGTIASIDGYLSRIGGG